MRTYLILKEKAHQFTEDAEIQALLAEIRGHDDSIDRYAGTFAAEKAAALKAHTFDRGTLGRRGRPYERLDQLLIELLLGVR